jgi:CHAT domain-containing protein/Tfp pilus assembly protein PilF
LKRVCIFFSLIVLVKAANGVTPEIEQQLADAEATYQRAQFDQAIIQFQPLLKYYEKQQDQQMIADITFKIGRSNRRLGNFPEAQKLLNRALQLHIDLGDQNGQGFDLTEIAIAYQRQGEYDESLKWSRKALDIHEQTKNSDGIARTLNNFGNIHFRKSEFEKAIEFHQRAIDIATKGENQEILGYTMSNLGQVYHSQGDYTRAAECYEKSKKVGEERGDLFMQSAALHNLSLIYWNQGDLKRALVELQRCAIISHQSGERSLESSTIMNLGSFHFQLGNYDKALDTLHQSIKMAEEMNDQGLKATALDNLALLEFEIGNNVAALDYARKSLKLMEGMGEKSGVAAALVSLAEIAESTGDHRAALDYYQKGVRVTRESGTRNRLAEYLKGMGNIYEKTGQLDKALEIYKEALAIDEAIRQKPGIGSIYAMIASAHRKKGNLSDAEIAASKAVEILKEVGQSDVLWPALYIKGQCSRDLGKMEESFQWMKQAIDIIDRIREGIGLPEQRSSYLEQRLDVYEELIAGLVKANRIPEAYEYVQRSKARAFLDLLAETRIDPESDLDPSDYRQKRKLLSELISLNEKIKEEYEVEHPDSSRIKKLEITRAKSDAQYIDLLLKIRRKHPRLAELHNPSPVKLSEAQALLDEQTVLLDYFVGQKESLVFAVTSGSCRVFHLPESKQLQRLVHNFLATLQQPEEYWETTNRSYSRYINLGALLYQKILKPAESISKGKKLVLAPDGPLSYLPFEALLTTTVSSAKKIDFQKLPYLASNHEIQYVPSISVLDTLTENRIIDKPVKQTAWIAFADPQADRTIAKSISRNKTVRDASNSQIPLPFARAEVKQISTFYPKESTLILVGKDASETNAKTLPLDQYRTLHFASHGLIDEERPQISALVLDGGGGEDGYLTMREVFDLKLNADLVVLSACKSGLGKQTRGEGVTGLARAFFAAGASSVLVSFWNVSDRSTADFMTAFYKNLLQKGLNKPAALKQARLEMIRNQKYSHPYYWAPFILIGTR